MIKLSLSLGKMLALVLLPQFLLAQTSEDGTEIVGPFRAKLAESRKFEALPLLPTIDTARYGKLTYDIPTRLLSLQYPLPTISPLALPQDKNAGKDLQKGFFLQAGFGLPLQGQILASYVNPDHRKGRYGAAINHHSGQGNLDDQNFGHTNFQSFYDYLNPKGWAAGGKIHYQLDRYRFYGYHSDNPSVQPIDVQQSFNRFGAQIHLFNYLGNKQEIYYRFEVPFQQTQDIAKSKEFILHPKLSLEKYLGAQKRHSFQIQTGFFFSSFNDSFATRAQDRSLVHFEPVFHYRSDLFQATAGLNLGSNEGSFYVLPKLGAQLNLAQGKLSPFVELSGNIETQTFDQFRTINPFLSSTGFDLKNQRNLLAQGGLRGAWRNTVYEASLGYKQAQNQAIFLNDANANYNRFLPVLDTISTFFIQAHIQGQILPQVQIYGQLGSFTYQTKTFDAAYHLPVLETRLGAEYQFQSKKIHDLRLRADFLFEAGTKYFDHIQQNNRNLKPLADFNLGASLFFKKNFAVFGQFNNLFNNRYQRWYRYPQIGTNFLMGIILKY